MRWRCLDRASKILSQTSLWCLRTRSRRWTSRSGTFDSSPLLEICKQTNYSLHYLFGGFAPRNAKRAYRCPSDEFLFCQRFIALFLTAMDALIKDKRLNAFLDGSHTIAPIFMKCRCRLTIRLMNPAAVHTVIRGIWLSPFSFAKNPRITVISTWKGELSKALFVRLFWKLESRGWHVERNYATYLISIRVDKNFCTFPEV